MMAVVALLVLLLSAFAGLLAGRRRAIVPAAIAVIPCAVVGGPEAAALALLASAGLTAGVHLHRVVAESSVPRAG
jgi:hypothetical protein